LQVTERLRALVAERWSVPGLPPLSGIPEGNWIRSTWKFTAPWTRTLPWMGRSVSRVWLCFRGAFVDHMTITWPRWWLTPRQGPGGRAIP
jgi:hypothetical protein